MAKGFMGNGAARVLYVNLSTETLTDELYGDEVTRKFVGGYGLAAKLLFDKQAAGVDALGPENHIGFFAGTCGGSTSFVSSRYMAVGKSPLTNTWGDANSGGHFGPTLKFAGYDGILCKGIAKEPVYLMVEDGQASLHDATALWGKDTYETEDILRTKHSDKAHVACIGPAGEKCSLIAGISTDRGRYAARSGLGAVMGAKKLKAVVVKGNQPVPIADPERLQTLRKEHFPKDKEFTKYGTAKETASYTEAGECPAKNWGAAGSSVFPTAWKITGDEIIKYQKKKYTCYKCPIACGAIMEVPEGPFATLAPTHKPQYETLGALGVMCLIDNPEAMIRYNEICNRTGLDTISVGGVIAFTIECLENGLISKEDLNGLDLTWGNAEAALKLTEMIAAREGFGDVLADGVKRAAEKVGPASQEYAIHVGGQELPMHDPKNTNGLALTYLLDATPGRHSQGGELLTPPGFEVDKVNKGTYTGRAEAHQKLVNLLHVSNAAGNCMLAYFFVSAQTIPQFISAVTGWDFDMEEAMVAGERIHTIRHAFNVREGYNPLDNIDTISDRIFGKKPLTEGPNKGIDIDLKTMTREYLEYIDWDTQTTKPSRAKLEALGLTEVIEALY